MTSDYMPESMTEKGESGFDHILRALRERLEENPQLREMPAEEVARQLVLDGQLEGEPAQSLVAEALEGLEDEGQSHRSSRLS
jgi:hypothetical protein